MTGRPHLTVFGFPVYFRTSVLVLSGVAVLLLREVGLMLVATLAGSILVHELGHSFAFRRYGTESHIVIHIFGGYSSPNFANKLGHREWVITAFAGPVTAFLLLGLPAWLLREVADFRYGYTGYIIQILIYFNIYWGAINLLPIWPLDGGRVLYHGSGGNWDLTKIVTLVLSVPAAFFAYRIGYTFAALFVAFNAYQVMTARAPAATGLPGHSRISAAAKQAKSYAAKPTKTRGAAGAQAVERVYRELLRGRPDRAEEPLGALRTSKHKDDALVAEAWGRLLAGEDVALEAAASPLLAATVHATTSRSVDQVAATLRSGAITIECAPALVILQRAGLLDATCEALNIDADGRTTTEQLERLTLDLGLVSEQIRVTASLAPSTD